MSEEELADFIERVTGESPKHGQRILDALSGLPEAYDKLKAENERLREAAHEAVDHVGYANYDSRIRRAHRKIDAALEGGDE